MKNSKKLNQALIKSVLGIILFYSVLALVYHIRWFVPYLLNHTSDVVPAGQLPLLWFVLQILNNLIFIIVALFLQRLFRNYNQAGYFDHKSLKVFNVVIISCLLLGLSGALQTVVNNFSEVHFDEWNSLAGIANLMFRTVTQLLIFKEPQTMYLLLAIVLWTVKQFVNKALFIKAENEAFV